MKKTLKPFRMTSCHVLVQSAAELICVMVSFGLLAGCTTKRLQPGEGKIAVKGGNVWYQIIGSGDKTPLMLVHGGPGSTSYYLYPLAALADERPVIFYDQLGCGRSARTDDTTLWTVERFVNELTTVRQALGLKKVHLFGHSWGSILTVEYLLSKPQGIESAILAGPALSLPRWQRDADSLRATLPDSVQAVLAKHEQAGTLDAPEYKGATMEYYLRFLLLKNNPWSSDVDSTLAHSNESVYATMWGPNEFNVTGSLKNYDRTDRLHELSLPVLFTCGRYDEATPAAAAYYQSLTPNAKLVVMENSAHLTMQDEPERYVQALREFLREVESK